MPVAGTRDRGISTRGNAALAAEFAGRYRVRFDVAQRLGDELRDLGFPTTETEVEVSERPLLAGARKDTE